MQIRYFVADVEDRLHRVPGRAAEGLWLGRVTADELEFALGGELRVVTVLVDDDLEPVMTFFLRLDLDRSEVTDESRLDALDAATAEHGERFSHPAQQRQLDGWPTDWRRQLAVALDVPPHRLGRTGTGGPLVMCDLWGVPLDEVLEYFEAAVAGE